MEDLMNFDNKVVLITGAGVGIGRTTAIMLAQAGAKLAINSLTIKNGSETLRQVQQYSEGIYIQGDVSIAQDAKRIVDETVAEFGQIDILINNAGIVLPGRVDNTDEADWDRTMAVNLKGTYLISKYAVLQMKKQGGGTIVHISSAVALKGVKDRAAYSASKGGVVALTKAMAADYLADNIRVNCVCPGTTDTPSLKERLNSFSDPEKARAEFIARQPMKRFGTEAEIATAVLFAASDEAGFMNGSIISIDGGMTM
jgi:meso-butanediol dehydrogenase/(S,S)-butanediol dehydrogenase/diacetyl reductase